MGVEVAWGMVIDLKPLPETAAHPVGEVKSEGLSHDKARSGALALPFDAGTGCYQPAPNF